MLKNLKRRLALLMGSIVFSSQLFAQKPAIDSSVFGKWPSINFIGISNDGNYCSYGINNQPAGSITLLIRSTHTEWETAIIGYICCQFSQDSKRFFFSRQDLLGPNDSIGIGTVGTNAVSYLPGVSSFQLINKGKTDNWLMYTPSDKPGLLVVRDLQTGAEKTYANVQRYWPSPDGQRMLVEKNTGGTIQLQWTDLNSTRTKTFWEGNKIGEVVPDHAVTRVAFTIPDGTGTKLSAIRYNREGMDSASELVNSSSEGVRDHYEIGEITLVNSDGDLFFRLKEKDTLPKINPNLVPVDVWSYKDPQIQSEQLLAYRGPAQYMAVFNMKERRIIPLEKKGMRLMSNIQKINAQWEYVLVSKALDGDGRYGNGEWNWNPHARTSICLLSLKDGSLRSVSKDLEEIRVIPICELSPQGKYVVYYNPESGNYFSYSIATGKLCNLTASIRTTWTSVQIDDEPMASASAIGIAAYLQDDKGVLLNDQFDIFQFDLAGDKTPACLTNGYGLKNNIVFNIAAGEQNRGLVVADHTDLILKAFNRTNKDDGFFRARTGGQLDPALLSMQPYNIAGPNGEGNTSEPQKARDADIYIVRKMSAEESPNYFLTTDFRTYKPLSHVYPERNYNWMTTELVTWKTPDGKTDQGILYKPENFDPHKKYPLIINYYEKASAGLHDYIEPEGSDGPIGIVPYISGGYLVFIPDIHFTVGAPGRSSYNCVVSAAQLLAQRPYVDAGKMGLQGHSWGGFQTNYIVTHSHLFAAAMSSSGMSDFVSIYNSIPGGSSRQRQYEVDRDRMGATLWDIPYQYIENSPVLRADQVSTPLLMMANQEDMDVPYQQGVEFFLSLRRLGKKAWMLQYDGNGHFASGKAGEDLNIRMRQFFDHYLKDAPPPLWMTRGVPARLKGIDSGLETDWSGQTP